MRVSTAQFYQQNSLQMTNKTSDVNEQSINISSGKRIQTAKDDAVQYSTLAGFNENLANIEKYQRNITMAEHHINLQEATFADVETLLNKIKEDFLLANNGRMSNEDLQTLGVQMRTSLDQVLDLANTQDEQGEYIFAGFQTEQQAFSQQVDGSVTYNGDSGVNKLQISKNITLATNQTGDATFLNVSNSIGDFSADYLTNTSGTAVESANITDRGTYNTSTLPHEYTFTFDAVTNDLSVTDSGGGVVFPATPYAAGDTISFDGIDVTLSGNPLPGDSFTISEEKEISVFSTINDAITWLEQGVIPTGQEQHQVDYNTVLDQMNAVMTHMSSQRADSGIRLQVLDSQKDRHLDTVLNISTGKSNIEDLDFAKAIAEFEQSKVALQASQQTFSQIQGLSLFNYI